MFLTCPLPVANSTCEFFINVRALKINIIFRETVGNFTGTVSPDIGLYF
jgi:hypothetical protein